MQTIRFTCIYSLPLDPLRDKSILDIARQHHGAFVGSGAGLGKRDLVFDFPTGGDSPVWLFMQRALELGLQVQLVTIEQTKE